MDLSFYSDLRNRLLASGDFAQAYVIAHEVGHRVQNLLGIMTKIHSMQRRTSSEQQSNALSFRPELQADCFAGIWAHHADRERGILERGDVEEGLNAAAQIGDDGIQLRTRGYVVPEGFIHGTAEERVRWFRQGLERSDIGLCNMFQRDALS